MDGGFCRPVNTQSEPHCPDLRRSGTRVTLTEARRFNHSEQQLHSARIGVRWRVRGGCLCVCVCMRVMYLVYRSVKRSCNHRAGGCSLDRVNISFWGERVGGGGNVNNFYKGGVMLAQYTGTENQGDTIRSLKKCKLELCWQSHLVAKHVSVSVKFFFCFLFFPQRNLLHKIPWEWASVKAFYLGTETETEPHKRLFVEFGFTYRYV